jgi:phosphoserine phosphatase RsbU/P
MRVLVAEDDPTSLRLLVVLMDRWGYDVVTAEDGSQAWDVLRASPPPQMAVIDWMMPEVDGPELCRRVRERNRDGYTYLILLTARDDTEDVIAGLESGADDYITKPFNHAELRSRLRAGERIVELEASLGVKVSELEEALAHVKQLQGIMPICMHCHKIRDEEQVWHRLEKYIQKHSEAVFTHALCADCLKKHYPEVDAELKKKREKSDSQ